MTHNDQEQTRVETPRTVQVQSESDRVPIDKLADIMIDKMVARGYVFAQPSISGNTIAPQGQNANVPPSQVASNVQKPRSLVMYRNPGR